jgi:hypothetical protein
VRVILREGEAEREREREREKSRKENHFPPFFRVSFAT